MRRRRGTAVAFAGTLLLAAGAGSAAVAREEAKTLARFHDPVIVETARLAAAGDRRVGRYRLMAAAAGRLEPIPFQFDARDDAGDLVLTGDEDGTAGSFDDNDELVFMAKDSGNRIGRAALPRASDGALEIEVTDPATGARGWAYLVHFEGDPPPASATRYATFDPDRNRVRTSFYEIDYAPGRNYYTGVRVLPAAGGTGGPVVTRMRVRIRPALSLLVTTWRPEFTEESFRVSIEGVKNGPVRAIRRVRQSLDLGRYFPISPSGTVYTYYYFSSFRTPSTFSVPWLVLKALRAFDFEGVSELDPGADGMRYWDGANRAGVPVAPGARLPVTDRDHDWWVVSGPGGTCLHAFVIPRRWREWGVVRGSAFIIGADTGGAGAPARVARAAGYRLLNMTNLRKPGDYQLDLAVIVLPRPYRPGDETEPLRMVREPLRVDVRALD